MTIALRFSNKSQTFFNCSALAVAALQRCSSRKAFLHPKNTSIFIINIELIFDFQIICFGTATLQRCNANAFLSFLLVFLQIKILEKFASNNFFSEICTKNKFTPSEGTEQTKKWETSLRKASRMAKRLSTREDCTGAVSGDTSSVVG
jgi:hypothetical protein